MFEARLTQGSLLKKVCWRAESGSQPRSRHARLRSAPLPPALRPPAARRAGAGVHQGPGDGCKLRLLRHRLLAASHGLLSRLPGRAAAAVRRLRPLPLRPHAEHGHELGKHGARRAGCGRPASLAALAQCSARRLAARLAQLSRPRAQRGRNSLCALARSTAAESAPPAGRRLDRARC